MQTFEEFALVAEEFARVFAVFVDDHETDLVLADARTSRSAALICSIMKNVNHLAPSLRRRDAEINPPAPTPPPPYEPPAPQE
ncbi:hypothetical protein sos41_31200 [Alphaproteobacteria bacterium SO-S41]|nr:hypothetical protein sos41_31200 [Alphaproteobacteria bacterium SO-S41]